MDYYVFIVFSGSENVIVLFNFQQNGVYLWYESVSNIICISIIEYYNITFSDSDKDEKHRIVETTINNKNINKNNINTSF